MISSKEYLISKKKIKYMNEPAVRTIANTAGLNSYEIELLMSLQKDKSKIQTCYEMCISETKYYVDLKRIMTKIKDFI